MPSIDMLRHWPHTLAKLAMLLAAAVFLAGCSTTPPESDIPWNLPQQWESTPALPSGFMQQ